MVDSQNRYNVTHKLTVEQKKYAAEVLNETDENREEAIAEIKRWIQENADLRARTEDAFILRYLRVCKFKIENTKTRIQNFQKHRAKLPEWYANRDPFQPKLQELFDLGLTLPLRKLDNQGRMVLLSHFGYDPSKFALSEVIKAAIMVTEIALKDSIEASLYGVTIVIDLEHVTLRHVAQAGPRTVMNVIHSWQGCYPMRIQSIIFVNMPEYAKIVLTMVRYFLNEKLKQRLHIHKTLPNSFTDIPSNILPIEYGGTDGTIQELKEHWKRTVEENRDWFINDDKYIPVS